MSAGLFISLEGPDGSGKSTQIEYLKDYFREIGVECVFTREPGGTHIGETIRNIILDKNNKEMSDLTETLLYAASRSQHVDQLIRPALDAGKVVVCDRFTDSSIAYQGYARGLGDVVAKINAYATSGLEPDVTFFIDIDPRIGKQRIAKGDRDRLESEKMFFHQKVYAGYKDMAARSDGRIITIDGNGTREEMRDQIRTELAPFVAERYGK